MTPTTQSTPAPHTPCRALDPKGSNPLLDTYVTPEEAAQSLPGDPHPNTLRRWMLDGIRGVKLRNVRAGRRRVTTPRWLAEFFEALGKVKE